MDENGYVIVTLLMKFRKIKLLTNDILLIIDAIRESDKLELITGDYKVYFENYVIKFVKHHTTAFW